MIYKLSNTLMSTAVSMFATVGIILMLSGSLQASHIVGGEMNYTCLGDNNYEITLTIYRDCYNADPRAFFDDPAYIGVFNASNFLVDDLRLPLLNNDTINPVLSDPCLFVPADVCVHTTTYRGVINLPYINGGYQLAYERCCRNETILNIVNPVAQGAIYNVRIDETSLLECNSNAKFKDWPPVFICVNKPIIWDHSAEDVDGDSLVYRLSTPLHGGSLARPKPVPTNNPPYDSIVWNDPIYGLDDLLGGEPLKIDSETGLITGLPNTMGQFVVGISVDEYRNGVKISETRRDFQYNVGECGEVEAIISDPSVQCDNLEVTFGNVSTNAEQFEWRFNDAGNPGAMSTLPDPTFTFSDTGTYFVTLIAKIKGICTDTLEHELFLQNNSIDPQFSVDINSCTESSVITITDQSVDPISPLNSWNWEMVHGEETLFSDQQNPTFTIPPNDEVSLKLTTTSENGCIAEKTEVFDASAFDPTSNLPDHFDVCIGQPTVLTTLAGSSNEFIWSPSNLFDDPTLPSPTITTNEDVTVVVKVNENNLQCSAEKEITISVVNLDALVSIPSIVQICPGEVAVLNEQIYEGITFEWIEGSTVVGTNDDLSVSPTENSNYLVKLTHDELGCIVEKEVSVNINNDAQDAADKIPAVHSLCKEGSIQLNFEGNEDLEYTWTPAELLDDASDPNPTATVDASATISVSIYDPANQCRAAKNVMIAVENGLDQFLSQIPDQVDACFGQTFVLNTVGNDNYTFEWSPAEPLDNPNIADPNAILGADVTFTVFVNDAVNECSGSKEVNVTVSNDPSALIVQYPDSILACKGQSIALSDIDDNGFAFMWDGDDSVIDDSSISNPTITPDSTTSFTLEIADELNNNCSASKLIVAFVPEDINLGVPTGIESCGDEPINIEVTTDEEVTYSWIDQSGVSLGTDPSLNVTLTQDEKYLVTVTDQYGCTENNEISVDFIGINAEIEGESMAVACEDEVQFNIINQVEGNQNNYEWGPLENIISGGQSTNPIVFNTSNDPIDFTLKITNQFGCIKEDNIRLLNAFDLDPNAFDRNLCLGEDSELYPTHNPSYTYQWEESEFINDLSDPNPIVTLQDDQTFLVTITNADGCETMRSIDVDVVDIEGAVDVTGSEDTIFIGQSLQLTATDNPGYIYQWIPPNGLSSASIANPVASPEETTNYVVMITDENGCMTTGNHLVFVLSDECKEPFIFFPNAFTPNGDGLNDVLRVRGLAIEEATFIVYNRWGQKVFESNNVDEGWDGTYKGKKLSPDVFSYHLMVRCFNGDTFEKQGNVTLLF